ncbi:MAG: YIP1 family protein [Acidobacteriota bacterium]
MSAEPIGVPSGGRAISRIFRVFVQPAEVFHELAATPSWLAPLVALLLVSIAGQLVIAPRIDFDATIRQSLAERSGSRQLSDEQVEQAVNMGRKMAKVTSFATPLMVPLMYLALAGIYFLGLKLLTSGCEFKSVFATLLHAVLPATVVSTLLLAVVSARHGSFAAQDLEGMLKSSVAAYLSPEAPKTVAAFASVLDIFNLWQWVLLAMGLQIVGKVSRDKAIALIAVLWLGWAAGKVGLAALR